ncbi:MAG: hypothetical protein ACOCV2_13980, partial [Persicimonas sp.]
HQNHPFHRRASLFSFAKLRSNSSCSKIDVNRRHSARLAHAQHADVLIHCIGRLRPPLYSLDDASMSQNKAPEEEHQHRRAPENGETG